MGKLNRGNQLDEASASVPRLRIVTRGQPEPRIAPARVSPEYQPVHDRLTALERLARLHEHGALTDEEYAAEKIALLRRNPDELVLNQPLIEDDVEAAPPLLGRFPGWKILPIGLAAGLLLSYFSQPRETVRFFEDAISLFGA